MTAQELRLCIHCEHFAEPGGLDGPACRRPLSDARSPLDGQLSDRLYVSAWNERRFERTLFFRRRCGKSARFFKQAPVRTRGE